MPAGIYYIAINEFLYRNMRDTGRPSSNALARGDEYHGDGFERRYFIDADYDACRFIRGGSADSGFDCEVGKIPTLSQETRQAWGIRIVKRRVKLKHLLMVGIFLLVAGCAAQAVTVTLTWNYDYTGIALCTTTTTASCLDHFEMDDATSGKPVLISTVANPASASGKVNRHQRKFPDVVIRAENFSRDFGGEGMDLATLSQAIGRSARRRFKLCRRRRVLWWVRCSR